MVELLGTKGRHPFPALRGWTLPLVLGAVLLGVGEVGAASPTDELRNAFAEVSRILADPEMQEKPEERLIAIRQIVRRAFDFREAAQAALGPEWRSRTAREQQEFVQLFGALLGRRYISRVASGILLDGEDSITYLGEAIEGNRVSVYTTMASKLGGTTAFEYRMLKRGAGWAIHDVVVDGISLVANYQAQFTRILQASSYGELVELMRAKASPEGVAPVPVASSPAASESTLPAESPSATTETPATPPPGDTQTPAPALLAEPLAGTAARGEFIPAADIAPDTDAAPPAKTSPPVEIAKADIAVATPSPLGGSGATPAAARAAGETRPAAAELFAIAVVTSVKLYWVQVGAFRSIETARRLTERLRQQSFPATHQRGERLTRVRVGPLPDRTRAVSTLRELEAKGYRPFLAEVRN